MDQTNSERATAILAAIKAHQLADQPHLADDMVYASALGEAGALLESLVFGDAGAQKFARARVRAYAIAIAPPADCGPVPTLPGTPFAGGFYAGRLTLDGQAYALVVAPKAEGERAGLRWKTGTTATPGARSLADGFANSAAMAARSHPAARFCRGLTIGGHADWYLPSRDELEVLYRNLKPTPTPNFTTTSRAAWWGVEVGAYNGIDTHGNGHNASVDAGEAYTEDSPRQTMAEAFQDGGAEAFAPDCYWSSTEFGTGSAWVQDFDDGNQYYYFKDWSCRVRAVRKVPL